MSFSIFKILKGLLISEENTLTPKEIEIVPGGTAGKKTTVVSSQTDNRTITLPDADDTLATETIVEAVQTNLDNHLNDTTSAHKASAIEVEAGITGMAAVDVQAALGELSGDISGVGDDLGNHISATSAHGTTSDVVGKDDSQVLTNKTISGSNNTLSNIASTSTTFASETSLDIGTSSSATTVNIGTNTGANTINIGGANSTVNINGTVNNQNVTNLDVKDKLVTLNKGGAAGSGAVSGIEVEEAGSGTGYVKTSADRNSWEVKAPNVTGTANIIPPVSGSDTVVLEAKAQVLTNKTIGDALVLDGQASKPANPLSGLYKAYIRDADGTLAILDSSGKETLITGVSSYVAVAGENLSARDAVYIASSADVGRTAGRAYKLDATNANRIEFAGFAKSAVSAGSNVTIDVTGKVEGFTGLDVGQPIFASVTVPGSFQVIPPGTIGQYVINLGVADSATSLIINGALSATATLIESPDMNIGEATGTSLVLNGTLHPSALLQADSITKGFLVPRMTQTQRDAISSPATGLQIYNTSSNKLNVYNGTAWGEVGSGSSGINYITDTDGTVIGNWKTYADTAGTSPVDGTGGSANVTFATSTNSDLRGTTNFLFTHDDANRRGQGFSYDFTIDAADQAKMLKVSFEYLVASGTYADGDLTVWIYDKTNAVLIQPDRYKILNAIGSQPWQGEFQTASNSTSYRVIFHVTTSTATAYTMRFDNFSLGPNAGWSSNTVMSSDAAVNVVAASYAESNAQTVNSGVVTNINWPAASIDTNNATTRASGTLSVTTGNWSTNNWYYTAPVAGYYSIDALVKWQPSTSVTGYNFVVAIYKNGSSFFSHIINSPDASGTNSFPISPIKRIVQLNAGDYIDIRASNNVSNTTTVTGVYLNIERISGPAQIAASETVAAKMFKTSGAHTSTGNWQTITSYGTKQFDTHEAMNLTSGTFTAPINGTYQVNATVGFGTNATGVRQMRILKNDTSGAYGGSSYVPSAAVDAVMGASSIVQLKAGETLKIDAFQTSGGNLNYTTYPDICVSFSVAKIGI